MKIDDDSTGKGEVDDKMRISGHLDVLKNQSRHKLPMLMLLANAISTMPFAAFAATEHLRRPEHRQSPLSKQPYSPFR